MLLYLTLAHRAWKADAAAHAATTCARRSSRARHRIRPSSMTVLTMMIGLLPVCGAGHRRRRDEAHRRCDDRGLVTSFVLELLVLPGDLRESESGASCRHRRLADGAV